MNRQRNVAKECPRRCRPDQQQSIIEGRMGRFENAHLEEHTWIAYDAVSQGELVRGKRCFNRRRLGYNLEPFDDEPAVKQLLERPPDAFNVLIGAGHVGSIKVHPKAHPPSKVAPAARHRDMPLHQCTAVLVEAVYPIGENVGPREQS